jgi:hypothetical protein
MRIFDEGIVNGKRRAAEERKNTRVVLVVFRG